MPYLKLIQDQVDAYNNRDLERFCSYYHPEIKVFLLLKNKLLVDGLVPFKERYKNIFENSPNLKCVIQSRIILPETIIDEELVTGSIAFPEGLKTIAIYSFKENLIDRVWFTI